MPHKDKDDNEIGTIYKNAIVNLDEIDIDINKSNINIYMMFYKV